MPETEVTCWICGDPMPARTAELIRMFRDGSLDDAQEEELRAADCARGCWAKEEASDAATRQK